MKHSTLI